MFFLKKNIGKLSTVISILVIGVLLYQGISLQITSPYSEKGDLIQTNICASDIFVENSLIANYTVSSPAPSITILNGRNSGNGFVSKTFHQGALTSSDLNNNTDNNYFISKAQRFFQIRQLHLAFCVFRI